jgi:hypothetical protein
MTSSSCNWPRAYMETGYYPIGDPYRLQGIFVGPNSGSGCASDLVASWTPMSSRAREQISYGYAYYNTKTPVDKRMWSTGCDDCNY